MSKEGKNIENITIEKNLWKFHLLSALAQSLYLKIDIFHSNQENTLAIKINKHTACGYSLFTQYSFDSNRNKHGQR